LDQVLDEDLHDPDHQVQLGGYLGHRGGTAAVLHDVHLLGGHGAVDLLRVDPPDERLETHVQLAAHGASAGHDERPDEVVAPSASPLVAHRAITRFLSSSTSSGV